MEAQAQESHGNRYQDMSTPKHNEVGPPQHGRLSRVVLQMRKEMQDRNNARRRVPVFELSVDKPRI